MNLWNVGRVPSNRTLGIKYIIAGIIITAMWVYLLVTESSPVIHILLFAPVMIAYGVILVIRSKKKLASKNSKGA